MGLMIDSAGMALKPGMPSQLEGLTHLVLAP
jgi:hypothetical protein